MKNSSVRENRLENHFLLMTSALVILIAVPAGISIVREPQNIDGATAETATKSDRQLASVNLVQEYESQNRVRKNDFSESLSLDLGCQGKNLGEVQGMHLRFKGVFCDEQAEEVEVKNITNGYTAAVFLLKEKNFTTDFIDLKEGENKIKISRKNSLGQLSEQEMIVSRTPASTEN